MVFSALLAASSERANRGGTSGMSKKSWPSLKSPSESSLSTLSARDPSISEYIAYVEQLPPPEPEAPDLRDLNNSLEALAAIFPDIQVEVFREMLSSFDGESRLALVADALLKSRISWVKGRWRVANKGDEGGGLAGNTSSDLPSAGPALVPPSEVFRSPEYKQAVMTLAWQEFKGLSRSTVNAVLAESNYSYLDARRTLVSLSSKSWRYTISSIFLRRKAASPSEGESHPLIVWKSSGHGSAIPCLKQTGNSELDRELFNELIAPLNRREKVGREERDHAMAVSLNNQEADDEQATHECECCFTSVAFEEVASCNANGHMICFRCVQHSIAEAVFGQGWHRSIDKSTGTLQCPAVDSAECLGRIPSDHIYRAMMEEKRGPEILLKLDQRLAEHSLLSSQLPLIRCPFCDYAEVDDIYLPSGESQLRLRANNVRSLIFILLCLGMVPLILPLLLLSSFLALILSSQHAFGDYMVGQFSDSLTRHRRRRRGLKFMCQNPRCARVSCLSCAKEWADIHVCHESSLVALRTQVEQAMSMAIKRVCPRCNTSFVKTAGCNKLTCPCGYKMCYVCRRDIGGNEGPDAGYRHFCEHFRPEGDPRRCNLCSKCNLWEAEDTEGLLERAKEEAERKWRETEDRELSGAERAFLETGVAAKKGRRGFEGGVFKGRRPTVAEVCDFIVENLFF